MSLNSQKALQDNDWEQEQSYTISDLAGEFDVTTRAIRFYEAEGMLSPTRKGRNRCYTLRDRTRLKLILRGKRLGFSLSEIAGMFALYDSDPGEIGQLKHILEKVSERRSQLKLQLDDIQIMMQELHDFETQCEARLSAMKVETA
ncbi:MAG: MerR family transcriptional regulator [Gammaproteobacteria bacterium]